MDADDADNVDRRWLALWVRPRCEKRVTQGLELRNLTAFLPSYNSRRVWSDRIRNVETLLFPGYVFCHITPADRIDVLKVPGVIQMVSFGGSPLPVEDSEIASIRQALVARLCPRAHPYLRVGERARVACGPLRNVEGIVIRSEKTRLVLSIDALERSVALEIDPEWLVPLESPVGCAGNGRVRGTVASA